MSMSIQDAVKQAKSTDEVCSIVNEFIKRQQQEVFIKGQKSGIKVICEAVIDFVTDLQNTAK